MNDVDRSRDYDDRDSFRSDDPDLEAYEYDNEDGGVRMPLFLILGLVVIAAVIGVWFVAYNQGLEDGRAQGQLPMVLGEEDAERIRPDSPGGLPEPRNSDVFGDTTGRSADTQVQPREEAILDLPPPRSRDIERVPMPGTSGSQDPSLRNTPPSTSSPSIPGPSSSFRDTAQSLPSPTGRVPSPSTSVPQPSVPPSSDRLRAAPGTGAVPPPSPSRGVNIPQPRVTPPPPTARTSIPAPSTGTVGPQPAPASASGNFVVQLASLPSAAAADQTWTRISSAMGDVLSGYSKDVQRADLGARGVFYRLRIGYFPSRSAANNLCQNLKARNQDCLVTSR